MMDKTKSAFGYESSGEERGPSSLIGWLEFIAITILCSSCKAFVMWKAQKFSTLVSHVNSCLFYSCVKRSMTWPLEEFEKLRGKGIILEAKMGLLYMRDPKLPSQLLPPPL